jgi:hypothetical protein
LDKIGLNKKENKLGKLTPFPGRKWNEIQIELHIMMGMQVGSSR